MVKRFVDHFQPIIATLLGIAAIATAFAAYQSGIESGTEAEGLTGSATAVNLAYSSITQATQQRSRDEEIFLTWVEAEQEDKTEFSEFIRENLMDDNLKAAMKDYEDPESETFTPVESPVYKNESADDAQEYVRDAEAAIADAEDAGGRADRYDLVTVILAVALFFFGIAAVLTAVSTRLVLTGIGTTILVVSIGLMAAV